MPELIVALDFGNQETALELAQLLRPRINWFKVGLELFVSSGPVVIEKLADLGCRIFLDLKIYDIPNTAAAAARAALRPGVGIFTLHLQGGERMCAAVCEALSESPVLCAGVTALTSFGEGEMPGINESPGEYGLYLAGKAQAWGLSALVCSANEAAGMKAIAPGLKIICPGIRSSLDAHEDQARIATPAAAARAGADFLVVGRPVTKAWDPVKAAENILNEIKSAN